MTTGKTTTTTGRATRIGVAGLGYWGPNLARHFDELAELTWICDLSPELAAKYSERYPQARATTDFADLAADPDLDAVVIATPVPTHYELAKVGSPGTELEFAL